MNGDYTGAELLAMQKEAERRVFEMQKRASRTFEYVEEEEEAPPLPPEPEREVVLEHKEEKKPAEGIGKLLEALGEDRERSLIMILLIILINENADKELIFVLLYLLL